MKSTTRATFTRYRREPTPTLRFSPTAWAKLVYLRDCGPSEVGGFGISSLTDLLLVEDLELVRQRCTAVSVMFDDNAVADYFDQQVDRGRSPAEFARIWIHTHPGSSARPSITDQETFARVFGPADWAIMFILAQMGCSYARLQFGIGPGGAMPVKTKVDFRQPFAGSNHASWHDEYRCNVTTAAALFADRNQTGRWESDDLDAAPAGLPQHLTERDLTNASLTDPDSASDWRGGKNP